MSLLPIIEVPDPLLRAQSAPLESVGGLPASTPRPSGHRPPRPKRLGERALVEIIELAAHRKAVRQLRQTRHMAQGSLVSTLPQVEQVESLADTACNAASSGSSAA